MATEVIHEHTSAPAGDNSGAGFVLGAVIFLAAVLFLLYFGASLFRGMGIGSGATNVQIPDKVDVNVQGTK